MHDPTDFTDLTARHVSSVSTPARSPQPKWIWLALLSGLVFVLVVAAVVLVIRNGDDDTPAATAADPRPLVTTEIGVFTGSEPPRVAEFSDWLGRDIAYAVNFFSRVTWADISSPQNEIDPWKDQPYRKVWSLPLLPEDPADTIQRGATGEYNGYFAELAKRLVESGQEDAILRVGWEFNLVDSRWATDDSTAFIAYWREIVTTMRAQPGQKFEFDWNPNNGDSQYDAVNYYPGSDVVDYIGVDAYDVSWASDAYPYPEDCDEACRTARQQVAWDSSIYGGARGLKFWSEFAAKQGKPMSLPEWGLWDRLDQHGGADNPGYLRRMSEFIADPANRVAYQAYFEYDGPDGPHRLMTTFQQTGEVFKSLFAKPV